MGNDTYRFGVGYGSDIIEDNDGDNKVELLDISSDAVSFEMTDRGELVITITESDDVLTLRNFDSERFTFEFADEVSGTFNVETGEFERILSEEELAAIEAAKTEDEFAQANAEILNELYADDNSVFGLLTENDNIVIPEITDSASTADENENTTGQIDIQVMILAENMAAFSNESNISDSMNMQSSTDNSEFANQLLVVTQTSKKHFCTFHSMQQLQCCCIIFEKGGRIMEKTQDSGLTCFMIVMKFHGIPITKEQAENLSVLDPEQKTGEIEIIESAKKLKMRARL